MDAYLRAEYRILSAEAVVPGAGLHCQDLLTEEELFLMDVAVSQTPGSGRAVLATRTIPLGEYWMTGGAALPIDSEPVLEALCQIVPEEHPPVDGPGAVPLMIVRACLAGGAADYVSYQSAEVKRKTLRREPRWPGSKRRRRH